MCILKGEYDVHADMKFKTYKFIARGGEMMDTNTIIFALLGLIVGAVVGFLFVNRLLKLKLREQSLVQNKLLMKEPARRKL